MVKKALEQGQGKGNLSGAFHLYLQQTNPLGGRGRWETVTPWDGNAAGDGKGANHPGDQPQPPHGPFDGKCHSDQLPLQANQACFDLLFQQPFFLIGEIGLNGSLPCFLNKAVIHFCILLFSPVILFAAIVNKRQFGTFECL